MPDDYIDGLFDDALVLYPDGSAVLLSIAAQLEGAKDLRAAALVDVDYTVNEVSEKLSQRYERLNKLVAELQSELDVLVGAATIMPVAQWGGLRKIPPPVRRYPTTGSGSYDPEL